ncbi:MAG: sulfite reductase subunit alpha [Arenimonas sp.]
MSGIDMPSMLIAIFLIVLWLVFTIASLRAYKIRENKSGSNAGNTAAKPLLIAYASQTGFAERLAEQTLKMLSDAGTPTQLVSLNSLNADTLANAEHLLFIVSTTGEGDPPDNAIAFARHVLSKPAELASLQFGLLSLGDRSYQEFCGFGRRLDEWLRHNGATPLFDCVEVDDGDAGALRHWQHHLSLLAGHHDLPDWSPPRYGNWTLSARKHLNPGSAGAPVFHIELTPQSNEDASWQAGDIAEIGPEHSDQVVIDFLTACKLDGTRRLDENETTLAQVLSRSALPPPENIRGLSMQELVARLTLLPHREYSIASIPADGNVQLLIRQMRRPDGSLGLGAGWLTECAPINARIGLRLRKNSSFHAPTDDVPLILIGNGTGIAGLRALLKERAAKVGTRNWLLFGERNAASDFHYRDELQLWHSQGRLERIDLAFSRNQTESIYVQQRLLENASLVRAWVTAGAAIYVCGSLKGMAPGVNAALTEILGTETLETLTAQGRYRRDVY